MLLPVVHIMVIGIVYSINLMNPLERFILIFAPNAQPFGRFINNQVHSTGRYGVWIYPQYAPSINGCGKNGITQIAVFDGLMAWNNHRGMEWVMSRTIQIRNALVFDNSDVGIASISAIYHNEQASSNLRSTFYNLENGPAIMDSIIIGVSSSESSLTIPSTAGLIGIRHYLTSEKEN